MSLLAPLYFLGALAVGLPILFHLIRRRPKGEVEFSSLMFLKPTPPRLTRRSRLENLPLLLIRALALILLAAAFARPFLRQTSQSDVDGVGRRIAIAIDTSASMRRADLWQQAKQVAGDVIRDIQQGDQLAIVTFDTKPATVFTFDQSSQMTPSQIKSTAGKVIDDLGPTWHASDLGRAISYTADLAVTHEAEEKLEDVSGAAAVTSTGPAQMVLITDMQAGSKIESLQVYAWPDELNLDVRIVTPTMRTNGWAKILAQGDSSEDQDQLIRVRVSNTSDAEKSQFRLAWKSTEGVIEAGTEMPVQVPPGESRVIPMLAAPPNAVALTVLDDDHSFDNDTFVTRRDPVAQKLLYIGSDADPGNNVEPKDSLFYYLSRVPLSNRFRHVTVEAISGTWPAKIDPKEVPLVTVATGVDRTHAKLLRTYINAGGRVLTVFSSEGETGSLLTLLREITGVSQFSASEANVDDYVMLSQIQFRDPMFASMADPQFNDFTKIRFWQHRTLSDVPESWKILATYDDDDPALLDVPVEGDGKLWVLTSGWQPESSQLALSTKFIPLVFQWFDNTPMDVNRSASYTIGERIELQPSASAKITGPDGTVWSYTSVEALENIDRPGVYRYTDDGESSSFAVNVAESESRTETLDDDALERFGVKLGVAPSAEQLQKAGRQLRDIELEGRQKLWQWLLIAGLAMLFLESWIGGRMSGLGSNAAA